MAMQQYVMLDKICQSPVTALAIASERRELFTTADDRYIRIWNLDDGRQSRSYDAHRGCITSLTWLSKDRMLCSTSLDHSVAIWNFKGESVVRSKFPCAIYSGGYSAKYDLLAIGGNRKMFILKLVNSRDDWDLNPQHTFEEHSDFISEIICTPAGRIFSCGYDGFICAFELNVEDKLVLMTAGGQKAKAKCHNGAITCATFNTEANTLITGGYDMVVKTWNYDSLTAHAQFIPLHTVSFASTVHAVCYVPATKAVWVGTQGNEQFHVFDPRTGTNLTAFLPSSELPKNIHGDHPVRIIAGPSGEAVTISEHKNLCIWKYNPLACVSIIRGHTDWVEMVLRHPASANEFISAGADSTVRRWHSPSALYPELYSLKEGFDGHQGAVLCGVLKPDASMLFTAGDDGMVRGWTLDDSISSESAEIGDACKLMMEGHDGRITGLCMLDHYLISVGIDQSVRVWDSNTGTLWKTIEDAHDSVIHDVDASPENDTFATCSSDGLGYIWSLETAELVGAIKGHSAEVSKIKWAALHSAWVTASEDSTLRMWHPNGEPLMKSDALRAQGRGIAGSEGEPILMKLETEGFSALAIQPESGAVIVGLSDSSVVVLDLAREVYLQVYKGHRDIVRSITCIPEKNQLVTAGWDHSIRVWTAVPQPKNRRPGQNRTVVQGSQELQEESGEPTKTFAEKNPPYEPVSLKNENGLARFGKSIERDVEPPTELTPQQKRDRAKQQSHMNWILKCIEEGNEEVLTKAKPKPQSKPANNTRGGQRKTAGGGGSQEAGEGRKSMIVQPEHSNPSMM